HVLISIIVNKHVVVQVDRAAHGIADESEPEPVVALDRYPTMEDIVLNRVPRDIERTTKWSRPAVHVDPAVDRREVDLHRRRICCSPPAVDRPGVDGVLLAAQDKRGAMADLESTPDRDRTITETRGAVGNGQLRVRARRERAGTGRSRRRARNRYRTKRGHRTH